MRLPRVFLNTSLAEGQLLTLPQEASHYLLHVLRIRVGHPLTLFNGQGGQYLARLVSSTPAQVQIDQYDPSERESPLFLTLVQAISRPQHMDYTVQKAVELGVQHLVPVLTERSPPLAPASFAKRHQHWQKIIINACEQCGRNRLPHLQEIQSLSHWLAQPQAGKGIVCTPQANCSLIEILTPPPSLITLLIGAEGGLTNEELQQAYQVGYTEVRLGPRILRTETVAIAALAICQAVVGDW